MTEFTNIPLKVEVDYTQPLEKALAKLKCEFIDTRITSERFQLRLPPDIMPDTPTRVMMFKLIEIKTKRPLQPETIEAMVRRRGYRVPALLEVCSLSHMLTPSFLIPPIVIPDPSTDDNYLPVLSWDPQSHTPHLRLKFWLDLQPDKYHYCVMLR